VVMGGFGLVLDSVMQVMRPSWSKVRVIEYLFCHEGGLRSCHLVMRATQRGRIVCEDNGAEQGGTVRLVSTRARFLHHARLVLVIVGADFAAAVGARRWLLYLALPGSCRPWRQKHGAGNRRRHHGPLPQGRVSSCSRSSRCCTISPHCWHMAL
jgi:hypothetical protein